MKALLLALALLCTGCAGLASALQTVGDISQGLGVALDVADMGQRIYFDRHPHAQNEGEVKKLLQRARVAHRTLEAARLTAQAADDGDLVAARAGAKDTYDQLFALLIELGIDVAKGPAGGAENDAAPIPQSFLLPTSEDLHL